MKVLKKYEGYKSDEFKRLEERLEKNEQSSLPSDQVFLIPYDKINSNSGVAQVRSQYDSDDVESLSYNIESKGLINPAFAILNEKNDLFDLPSGNHRKDGCQMVIKRSLETAREHGIAEGLPCYVFKKGAIPNKKTWYKIGSILNDHEKNTPLNRQDLVDSILSMYRNDNEFVNDDGSYDSDSALDWLLEMKLNNFTNRQCSNIAESVTQKLEKESRLTQFTEGTIVTYPNNNKQNGKLFKKFKISNKTAHEQVMRKDDKVIAQTMRGIGPKNNQWITEHLAYFADYILDLEDDGIVTDERILYWHVKDVEKSDSNQTGEQCLDYTRERIVEIARKLSRKTKDEYVPTKIAFVPQYRIESDDEGNVQYGEEIKYYAL